MNKAARLAKMESALKLCEWCAFVLEQEGRFRDALLSLGVKPIEPEPGNTRAKRCDTCGQPWLVYTGYDTPKLKKEERVLDKVFKHNDQNNLPSSREVLQRCYVFNEAIEQKQREHYGAEIFSKAMAATRFPEMWEFMREQIAGAPTEAELQLRSLKAT